MGILTETPGLYDRLSAYRNLTIYAKLYEVDDVDGQVEKYLRLLGLWERRNDDFKDVALVEYLWHARVHVHERDKKGKLDYVWADLASL